MVLAGNVLSRVLGSNKPAPDQHLPHPHSIFAPRLLIPVVLAGLALAFDKRYKAPLNDKHSILD